jgi:hypothetical protein
MRSEENNSLDSEFVIDCCSTLYPPENSDSHSPPLFILCFEKVKLSPPRVTFVGVEVEEGEELFLSEGI